MKLSLSTVIVLALTLALTVPTAVFALPEVEQPDIPDSVNVTTEYRFLAGETIDIPAQITRAGRVYRLVSQTEPILESTLSQTRIYTYKIDGNVSLSDLTEFEKLPNVSLTPVYAEKERQVDKDFVISNLPNNDVDYLPVSKEFSVSSAISGDGLTTTQLRRAGVTYAVSKYDDLGEPTEYEATIVFRGIETYTELGYYRANVTYQTAEELEGVAQYIVTAVYAPVSSQGPISIGGDVSNDGNDGNVDLDEGSNAVIQMVSDEEPPVPLSEGHAANSLWTTLIVCALLLIALLTIFLLVRRKIVG
jgi:hypothetical protein